MPKDIHYAHIFQAFNTLSFAIVTGAQMVLYFKFLDASATVIGIVTALPSLLNLLQIPAASLVEKVGYRAFVLRGWTTRTFIILGIAAVPLLGGSLGTATCLALMLFLLFAYNTSRGISVCGFLPWMTHLVPESVRGTFISRDQACGAFANFAGLLGTAALLTRVHGRLSFAVIFGISFAAAAISLFFLRRIPDVPVPAESRSQEKVPWREMLLHPPFRKLLLYTVIVNAALAGAGVFWVPTLRDVLNWTDARVLMLCTIGTAISVAVLWGFGRMIDRVGSRPLLVFAGFSLIIHWLTWCAIATRLLELTIPVIIFLEFFSAFGNGLFPMATTRLAMGSVPVLGRSHFFALFSVVNSLTLGLLPIAWGILIDALHGFHLKVGPGPGDFNRYSLAFLAITCVGSLSFYALRQLEEARAMTTDAFFRELLIATPSRAITRLLGLRRFFLP